MMGKPRGLTLNLLVQLIAVWTLLTGCGVQPPAPGDNFSAPDDAFDAGSTGEPQFACVNDCQPGREEASIGHLSCLERRGYRIYIDPSYAQNPDQAMASFDRVFRVLDAWTERAPSPTGADITLVGEEVPCNLRSTPRPQACTLIAQRRIAVDPHASGELARRLVMHEAIHWLGFLNAHHLCTPAIFNFCANAADLTTADLALIRRACGGAVAFPELVTPANGAHARERTAVLLGWTYAGPETPLTLRIRRCETADCSQDDPRNPLLPDREVSRGAVSVSDLMPGTYRWTVYSRDSRCAEGRCAAAARILVIDANCACSSGDCCDGCAFSPTSTVCDEEREEFRCTTSGSRGAVEHRTQRRFCSGTTASCTGATSGSWERLETCDADERCVESSTRARCETACIASREVCNGRDDDCDGTVDEDGVCGPACVCTGGACCDGCNYRPTTTVCGETSAFRCSGSTSTGVAERQVTRTFCSGGAAACGGARVAGAWEGVQRCAAAERCEASTTSARCVALACAPGASQDCASSSQGVCGPGRRTCSAAGAWSVCAPVRSPVSETCNNLDDDCDGSTDELLSMSCYTGPGATRGVGACHDGAQACVSGVWGACVGQVTPVAEICNSVDDDCDGATDEGACAPPAPTMCDLTVQRVGSPTFRIETRSSSGIPVGTETRLRLAITNTRSSAYQFSRSWITLASGDSVSITSNPLQNYDDECLESSEVDYFDYTVRVVRTGVTNFSWGGRRALSYDGFCEDLGSYRDYDAADFTVTVTCR